MGWVATIISAISAAKASRDTREAGKTARNAQEANDLTQKEIQKEANAEAAEKKRLLAEERAIQEGKMRDLESKRRKRATEGEAGSTLKTGVDQWRKQQLGA
jgi:hypothetical protein